MAGLGLLLYGALRSVVGVGKMVENKQMKDFSYKIDEEGRPTWIDREGKQYINGEKVVATYDYEKKKLVYAGQRTGTVYIDPEQNIKDRADRLSEERRKEAIAEGKLAYMRYDHSRKIRITCEISTGKFIAELEGRKDGTYWKYYLGDDREAYNAHCKSEGDPGVQITREEFDGLNIYGGTHTAVDYNRNKNQYYRHCGTERF